MFRLIRVVGFALAFGNMAILFPAPNLHDFRGFVMFMILGIVLIGFTEKNGVQNAG